MIVNLTPHPIRIYGFDVPDRFNDGDFEPQWTIDPSGTVARIGEIDLGTQYLRNCEVPVEYIEYRHVNGLPPAEKVADQYVTWYVVSLALALASDRGDLLVPYREIRNLAGTTIGCRLLALPV